MHRQLRDPKLLGRRRRLRLSGFYATSYTFSSVGVFAVATLFWRTHRHHRGHILPLRAADRRRGRCRVHGGALFHAARPQMERSTAQLFCASSLYYAASWLTTIVIICLYWANGEVFSSAQWRVYGAQALILHSNQLVVPLLIGLWWRHLMNGVLEKAKTKGVSLDVGSQA